VAWASKYVKLVGFSTGDLLHLKQIQAFLSKRARVYVAGRQSPRAHMALDALAAIGKGELKFLEMDLTSLDSTCTAAQEFLRLVILV
jgi:NAD(P)-dependent dehydrogenase (short-subunit alcohol dehydrogenase family)